MKDIRSFFPQKSGGGGGGSSKPSKPKSMDSGKSARKHNKGIGKMTMETTPVKDTNKAKSNAKDDDDSDVVEEVVRASTQNKKPQQNRKDDAGSSDGVVEIVPAPKAKSPAKVSRRKATSPSPKARKKRKVEGEDGEEGYEGGSTGKPRRADRGGKATPSPVAKKSVPAANSSGGGRNKRSRGSGKRVVYKEDSDDEDEGEDEDDDDAYSDAEEEADDDRADSGDGDGYGDDDDFDDSNAKGSSLRKRKSASSGGKGKATTSSRHLSPPSSAAGGKSAKPSSSTSSPKPGKSIGKKAVDLAGTSSDEEAEEEVTPPPKKKLAKAKEAPKDGGTKKSGGSGGGGGFRPWMGGTRKAPPNEGQKEVPRGADQCLAGKTFVVSGVLDSLGREAAEDLIEEYGGKVTGSVSSKTTYLLLGSVLDDGRPPEDGSKYKKAQQHKTTILDEDGLFGMLRDSNPQGKQSSSSTAYTAAAGSSQKDSPKPEAKPAIVANPYAKAAVANPYASFAAQKAATAPNPYAAMGKKCGARSGGGVKPPAGASNGKGSSSTPNACNKSGQMWVDKYTPQTTRDLIGQAGQVKKLQVWLQNWEGWHLRGEKPPLGKENPGARAALLSGVPGVGKSSTATLVAKEMGYHVLELNASDTRNKSSLSLELDAVIGNQCLGFTPDGGTGDRKPAKNKGSKKQLVVMDEVDGMGGSDRGGIQELISLIKKSKVPIIAICNDRQHPKIRSLVNHCYDLRFNRPQKATIAKRVKAIATMEGMDVDDNAAEMLVEANGNDIRQVLHALQMWSRKSSKMSYMNLKGGLAAIEKDKCQRFGPFEAARSILEGARTPLRERYELFFTDYSLIPLLVHQNYPSSLMNIDAKTRTEVVMRAAAACSDADIISGKMRGDVQHWELLPAQAALNVRVGFIGGGRLGYPEFPKWLGNYSKENKRRRLLGELSTHLNASISGGPEAVRLSYLHFLRNILTRPLRERGADGAQDCVDMLEEYGLSRDDLFEIMPEFVLSTKGMKQPPVDVFACLDGGAKAAVTRCYNANSHKSQALVETMQAPKRNKKVKAPPRSLAMAGEEEDEEEEEEEESDDDVGVFKKKGKSRSPAGSRAKAAAKPRVKKAKK